ncbi:hypothetical protein RND81_14G151800 [Saponaria officinalis]|uniref:Uncharacterized protein n=1 Tax=Saponaria officinalis TaxID=3572 RepID=A0AAW1GQM6_SAPOF
MSKVVSGMCVKPSTIILTLEDKGGLKGTGKEGVATRIILMNAIVITIMVNTTVTSDVCGYSGYLGYSFAKSGYVMHLMLFNNENIFVALYVDEESCAFSQYSIPFNYANEVSKGVRLIFVFDPGGLAMIIHKACNFSSKINLFLPQFCGIYVMLEDKDHFKGSVMIHTILCVRYFSNFMS